MKGRLTGGRKDCEAARSFTSLKRRTRGPTGLGAATTPPHMARPPCGPGAEPPLGVCRECLSQDSATPRQREAFADFSAWHQPSMEKTGPWHLTASPGRWRCSGRQYHVCGSFCQLKCEDPLCTLTCSLLDSGMSQMKNTSL